MKFYRADLHIHTLLSPCGDLSMSPLNIVSEAIRKDLDIIGITDHNSTRQSRLVCRLGTERGIYVLRGAEVMTILMSANPEIDFLYSHKTDKGEYRFSSKETKEFLRIDNFNDYQLLEDIKEMINQNLNDIIASDLK